MCSWKIENIWLAQMYLGGQLDREQWIAWGGETWILTHSGLDADCVVVTEISYSG